MPWRASVAAELVVHHLDLLVDQDVRQLDGRVGDRVFDDPIGEVVARPVERVPLEPGADVGTQRIDVREVAEGPDEIGIELGQHLLAELLELDLEMGRLAGQLGLGVVVGEGDVERGGIADLQTQQVGLEAGDEALLTEDERHPLGRAALERLAVARALERDDRVVAVLSPAILDRSERRVLVAQLVDHLVDPGVVDLVDLRRES